jgi:hypothetical protein
VDDPLRDKLMIRMEKPERQRERERKKFSQPVKAFRLNQSK